MIPLQQLADDADVTYRQATYWVSTGHFAAVYTNHQGTVRRLEDAGSGSRCWLEAGEAQAFRTTARLVKAGIALKRALQLARELEPASAGSLTLGPGLTLVLEDVR